VFNGLLANQNESCLFNPDLTFYIWKHTECASVKPLYRNVNAIKAKFLGHRNKMSKKAYRELNPPERLLLGAGPSNVDPRVQKALLSPIVEHLDPYFSVVMDETVELLRYAFQTRNHITLPISGTGSAGMEAAVCNLVERGDEVVTCTNGFFGERMKEMVNRCGGKPVTVAAEWGNPITKEDVEKALSQSHAKVVTIVHAETSTGILQPLAEITKITHEHDALLVVDAVTSLGGCKLDVDKLGIDMCYSASQKCLNCPPGLAPVTASERAMEYIRNRKTKVQSWYFDLSTIEEYWIKSNRAYHHTAPILLVYALHEALKLLYEEGLEARWQRHKKNSMALANGAEALGVKPYIDVKYRCPALVSLKVPQGVPDINMRTTIREEFGITISGGLGQLSGQLWRVGLMGLNSTERNVILVLEAFERALKKEGYPLKLGIGVAAAMKSFSAS
jgi:alanine-glyoxylate transaminase/serine-glyoxylate transaminase/serine-pyruvate transaminase